MSDLECHSSGCCGQVRTLQRRFIQTNMKKLSQGVRYGARDAALKAISGAKGKRRPRGGDAERSEGCAKQESKGAGRKRGRDVGGHRVTSRARSTRKKKTKV